MRASSASILENQFEVLCELYRRHFSVLFAMGGANRNDLRACMKTVGLAFLEGRIQIVNQGRWRQGSMLERGGTKINERMD
jgi:peptide methionine sulfoxide reductase MsrB